MFNTDLINQLKTIQTLGELPMLVVSLCIDSRKYQKGELFLCLRGPSFDGFEFAEDIISKGCKIVIFESSKESSAKAARLYKKNNTICLIEVENSINYLQDLSVLRLKQWRVGKQVIGITGSNGKTTHKEMLFGILEKLFPLKVFCTVGNLNNHIGVPLTILSVSDAHHILIVEMGSNHPGEIALLCDIVKPDSGLITNIGAAHLEFFKTEAGVFKEKRTLFEYIKKRAQGPFVANYEDKFLCQLQGYEKLTFFDSSRDLSDRKDGDVNIIDYRLNKNILELSFNKKKYLIENKNLFGDFNFKNLIACLILSYQLFPKNLELIIEASKQVSLPSNNRSTWIEKNNKEIFLDAYNANPSSMSVALNAYSIKMKEDNNDISQVVIIVGDMNELGELARPAHKNLGLLIDSLGFLNVIFVGQFCSFFLQGMQTNLTYDSTEELISDPPEELLKAKFIFIKASRSLQLESLIDIV
jgi:UDP-N-acetylmuramoyl-tripeptide--D-alanyl-D-alanine ligase